MDNLKTPIIHARRENQFDRIKEGVESGQLTHAEVKQLKTEERGIRGQLSADRADGNVTPAERAQVRQELNQTSRDIFEMKHNAVNKFSGSH